MTLILFNFTTQHWHLVIGNPTGRMVTHCGSKDFVPLIRKQGLGAIRGTLGPTSIPRRGQGQFRQSVVYMCAHTHDGAMGIVINRPLSNPSFEELLRQLKVDPVPPAREIRLCKGGPIDNARGFVLHTSDWTDSASLKVDDTLALTASLDILKAIATGGGPRQSLLALGYSGWGPGQLDAEMQNNAWLSAPADLDVIFDNDHDTKWRRALAKLRVDPLLLSSTAGRA